MEDQINELHDKCGDRQLRLEASKSFHEFMRDSEELEKWIAEQMVVASSEDYGQYYEQLQASCNLMFTLWNIHFSAVLNSFYSEFLNRKYDIFEALLFHKLVV